MSPNPVTFVLFEVAGTTYAVNSADVQHIDMLEQVTLVPNANPAVDGVVFSRGQVIPALNLRSRFGFPRTQPTIRTRIIFVKVQNRVVGLVVDSAREFRNMSKDTMRAIEETLTGVNGNYLKAAATVGDRLVLLLDLDKVLNLEAIEPQALELPHAQALPPLAAQPKSDQISPLYAHAKIT
jgi:purine-binding chemotaxis protein CheW